MRQKYTFPRLDCPNCPFHQYAGSGVGLTRYCGGFPNKRTPKRFKRSDPKYKPPKWCPRRISPPVCRIYGFVDQESEYTDWIFNRKQYDPGHESHISVSASRYKLRLEMTPNMTANQFFDAAQLEGVHRVLSDAGVTSGEIIEIDDGLKPYYFYCLDGYTAIPLLSFDRSRVQPSVPTPSAEGGEQG